MLAYLSLPIAFASRSSVARLFPCLAIRSFTCWGVIPTFLAKYWTSLSSPVSLGGYRPMVLS